LAWLELDCEDCEQGAGRKLTGCRSRSVGRGGGVGGTALVGVEDVGHLDLGKGWGSLDVSHFVESISDRGRVDVMTYLANDESVEYIRKSREGSPMVTRSLLSTKVLVWWTQVKTLATGADVGRDDAR